MGYEFNEVAENYFAHSARLAEWIAGLTIGEVAFIISQKLYQLSLLFYLFLGFSFLSIILSVLVMYVIAIVQDGKLHGVLTLAGKEKLPPREAFDKSFDARLGKVRSWLVNVLIDIKAFQWLVISFLAGSVIMILLVYGNLISTQNCG